MLLVGFDISISWFAQITLLLTHSYTLKYLKGTVSVTAEAAHAMISKSS